MPGAIERRFGFEDPLKVILCYLWIQWTIWVGDFFEWLESILPLWIHAGALVGTNSFDLGAMAQDNTITLGGVIWSFCITTEELSLILAFGSMIQDKVVETGSSQLGWSTWSTPVQKWKIWLRNAKVGRLEVELLSQDGCLLLYLEISTTKRLSFILCAFCQLSTVALSESTTVLVPKTLQGVAVKSFCFFSIHLSYLSIGFCEEWAL